MKKIIMWLFVFALFLVPNFADARGFSGGHASVSSHSSFSSHSTTTHSYSSSRTTTSRSYSSSHTTTTSKPKVNLSKSTTTSTSKSRTYSSGYRKPSSTVTYHAGSTYKSRTTRVYVNHHYVSVNHYYHAGYSPSGWFGYYHGFSTGMFMGSMFHPWGHTYYVGHSYVNYGPSPLAWVIDIFALLILLAIVVLIVRAARSK